jgi:hypothetical protein
LDELVVPPESNTRTITFLNRSRKNILQLPKLHEISAITIPFKRFKLFHHRFIQPLKVNTVLHIQPDSLLK